MTDDLLPGDQDDPMTVGLDCCPHQVPYGGFCWECDEDESGIEKGDDYTENDMTHFHHTPGPWSVVAGDNYRIEAAAIPDAYPHLLLDDDLGRMVAMVGNRQADFGYADAALIAAAPFLLEALHKLVEAADDSDGCQYGTLSTSFVRDIAASAISKATNH